VPPENLLAMMEELRGQETMNDDRQLVAGA
jgi:hypothetical protein